MSVTLDSATRSSTATGTLQRVESEGTPSHSTSLSSSESARTASSLSTQATSSLRGISRCFQTVCQFINRSVQQIKNYLYRFWNAIRHILPFGEAAASDRSTETRAGTQPTTTTTTSTGTATTATTTTATQAPATTSETIGGEPRGAAPGLFRAQGDLLFNILPYRWDQSEASINTVEGAFENALNHLDQENCYLYLVRLILANIVYRSDSSVRIERHELPFILSSAQWNDLQGIQRDFFRIFTEERRDNLGCYFVFRSQPMELFERRVIDLAAFPLSDEENALIQRKESFVQAKLRDPDLLAAYRDWLERYMRPIIQGKREELARRAATI